MRLDCLLCCVVYDLKGAASDRNQVVLSEVTSTSWTTCSQRLARRPNSGRCGRNSSGRTRSPSTRTSPTCRTICDILGANNIKCLTPPQVSSPQLPLRPSNLSHSLTFCTSAYSCMHLFTFVCITYNVSHICVWRRCRASAATWRSVCTHAASSARTRSRIFPSRSPSCSARKPPSPATYAFALKHRLSSFPSL